MLCAQCGSFVDPPAHPTEQLQPTYNGSFSGKSKWVVVFALYVAVAVGAFFFFFL